MHDDVRAVVDRLQQVRRRQRVVDDQRHAGALGDLGDGLDVDDHAAGIGNGFDEDRLGARRDRRLEGLEIVGIGPFRRPAEVLVAVVELVDRAAIELGRGDEFVAGRQQGVEGEEFRRMAGGDAERSRAALERCDALFQHRRRRVGDARVDVAERLQAEQRGGMVDVVEDEGGRLVDRRCARAGRGIGLGAGMDGEGGKAGDGLVGHIFDPFLISVQSFVIENARAKSIVRRIVPEDNGRKGRGNQDFCRAFHARIACSAPSMCGRASPEETTDRTRAPGAIT